MSIKKLLLMMVLGLSFCMTGCENGQKVDSEKEFSTNDISEIAINNSSWDLKIEIILFSSCLSSGACAFSSYCLNVSEPILIPFKNLFNSLMIA